MAFNQPAYFTQFADDPWIPWAPTVRINESDLAKRALNGSDFVIIGDTRVHALRFWSDDGYSYKRWDCINGFAP